MHLSRRATGPWALSIAAVLLLMAAPAAGQTTGKIEGRVTDAQTGQPLVGAQVFVVGTRLGNITNQDGYYFINNVPAGVHDIRAQYIGYREVTVAGQRVLAGQTMTVNIQLSSQAIALEAITVEGETNPLVPRDKTVSKSIVTGDIVEQLPVDRNEAVVALQPGVVDYGDADGHVIRGGRPGEAAVYVDGVLVRSFNTGSQGQLDLGTNAVEEVSVLTGGFGAEYGQAQSGIINYVTRTGGTNLTGAFTFGTDELFPKDVSYGISRAEFSLGGPLMGERASFHIAATAEGREDGTQHFFDMKGAETIPLQPTWFRPVAVRPLLDDSGQPVLGEDGQPLNYIDYEPFEDLGNRKPYNNRDHYSLSGTLRFNPTDNTRISVGAVRSRDQGLSFWEDAQFRPKAIPAFRNTSSLFRLGLEQIVHQSAESQATIKVNVAYGLDENRYGTRADTTDLEPEGSDFLGFRFSDYEFLFEDFTVDRYMERLEAIRRGEASDPLVPVEVLGITATEGQQLFDLKTSSANPYGVAFWYTSGFLGYQYSQERTLTFDVDLDFQLNRVHRFGAGVEFYRKHVENISSSGGGSISAYDTYFQNVYDADPIIGAVYVKDRMDIGEMVIDAGIRMDFFDSDVAYPELPGLVYPFQPDGSDDPRCAERVGERCLPRMIEQERIVTWSPRLGVAFPISDVSSFRLSYGHFFQIPAFRQLFSGLNTDLSKTNTNTAYGRPVQAMKAVQFEAGLSHLFNPYTVLDITAYNKDKLSDATYRIGLVRWPDSYRGTQDARLLTNLDFGNIRGVDVRLTRRYAEFFTGILGYSLLDSKGTGSDPYGYILSFGRHTDPITGAPLSPPQAIQPTDFDQRHTFSFAATANFPADVAEGSRWNTLLRNTNISVTTMAASGLPYTRSSTPGALARAGGYGFSPRYIELVNASRMPWTFNTDAKLTRGFRFGAGTFSAFLDIRNLFDNRNIQNVYSYTGSPTDPGDIAQIAGGSLRDDQVLGNLDPATRLVFQRQQDMLARYGYDVGDPDVVTREEQLLARTLAYIADEAVFYNYGPPRRFRLGFEYIF